MHWGTDFREFVVGRLTRRSTKKWRLLAARPSMSARRRNSCSRPRQTRSASAGSGRSGCASLERRSSRRRRKRRRNARDRRRSASGARKRSVTSHPFCVHLPPVPPALYLPRVASSRVPKPGGGGRDGIERGVAGGLGAGEAAVADFCARSRCPLVELRAGQSAD